MGNDGKLFEELIFNKYQSQATRITNINDEYEMTRRYVVKKIIWLTILELAVLDK